MNFFLLLAIMNQYWVIYIEGWKIVKNRTIIQYLLYVMHWNYLATMFTEAITVNIPEQLGNIQVPKRASCTRAIMLELSRITFHLLWLGPFMIDKYLDFCDYFLIEVAKYQKLIKWNLEVLNWGLSGLMLRASKIQWDLHKVDRCEYSLAPNLVRINEMTESIKIIQLALEGTPEGPYENLETQHFNRIKDPEWNDFEYQFIRKKTFSNF
ncbi:hypothetical protein Pfo_015358 [Paulownia fortunei]|nr:hypothetical protein Pfo_015358 [Paulownia fortunei]